MKAVEGEVAADIVVAMTFCISNLLNDSAKIGRPLNWQEDH